MKMAVWFSGYKKLLLVLMGLALLGACGSETDEDLTTPTLTMDAIDPSTFTKERTLSGQIEAGAGLDVFVSSGAKVGEINIEDGTWSCTITDLAVGNNLVTISADDSQGNTRSLQFILTYDLFLIDQADTTTKQTSSTVHGRLAPADITSYAATIDSVTLNNVPLATPTDGFAFPLNLDLATGNNTVAIAAKNTAGETQTKSLTIVQDATAVSLTIVKPPIPINVQSYRLSGTVEDGATVAVSVDPDEPPISVSPDATSWQVTISDLEERDTIITATASKEGKTGAAWTRIVVASPIVEMEPADLAENVLPDTVLKATFSEAVVASTVNETTFRLTDDQGTPVVGEVAYSAADTSATFTPAASLAPGSYTATLEGIEDPDGNTVNHTWDFTVVQ
jgi:hypothetical protein